MYPRKQAGKDIVRSDEPRIQTLIAVNPEPQVDTVFELRDTVRMGQDVIVHEHDIPVPRPQKFLYFRMSMDLPFLAGDDAPRTGSDAAARGEPQACLECRVQTVIRHDVLNFVRQVRARAVPRAAPNHRARKVWFVRVNEKTLEEYTRS